MNVRDPRSVSSFSVDGAIDRADEEPPIWFHPDWNGPPVERRPDNADLAEWPEGSVERVLFRSEDFPRAKGLPAYAHFGADGWPLIAPQRFKHRFDPAVRAELHRHPFMRWGDSDWLLMCERHERFLRMSYLLGTIIPELLRVIPGPGPGA